MKIKEAAILKDIVIYTGRRHCDIIKNNPNIDFANNSDGTKCIQGFITEVGTFVDRKMAGRIAFESGQIKKPTELLFSEDLYLKANKTHDNSIKKEIIEMKCPGCFSDMKEFVLHYRCRNLKCRLKVEKYFGRKL